MIKIRFFIISVVLTLGINAVYARKVPGFIIKNSNDTILGEVSIPFFDPISGGIIINGIDLKSFQSVLYFREKNTQRFRAFTPEDIAGFGFTYKSTDYKFKTLLVEYKSLVSSERQKLRFLNLIYQGHLALYKEITTKESYFSTGTSNKYIDYYDYYLYDDRHGLKRVIKSNEFKTLGDLFRYYGINQNFIDIVPASTRFKDIMYFLETYDIWKRRSRKKTDIISLRD